jgi:uncharacterized membrane protein YhaH (DUF805 family)
LVILALTAAPAAIALLAIVMLLPRLRNPELSYAERQRNSTMLFVVAIAFGIVSILLGISNGHPETAFLALVSVGLLVSLMLFAARRWRDGNRGNH